MLLLRRKQSCLQVLSKTLGSLNQLVKPSVMTAPRSTLSHQERTATEPRHDRTHTVRLTSIEPVNEKIRLLYLTTGQENGAINFRPGQWLDVHIPGISKAGGFTITSTPKQALGSKEKAGFLELAVQESPSNPAAVWLWRQEKEILDSELTVRVGGSFCWPPPGVELGNIRRLLMIAGGVGINPLISILASVSEEDISLDIDFFYTTRLEKLVASTKEVLFLDRLEWLARTKSRIKLHIFFTGTTDETMVQVSGAQSRRLSYDDIRRAFEDRALASSTVCYVCGPPAMTDDYVAMLQELEGMEPARVLCEKWW